MELKEISRYVYKKSGELAFIFESRFGLPLEIFQDRWKEIPLEQKLFLIEKYAKKH